MDKWTRVADGFPPEGLLLETYHEDESNGGRATNLCYWRRIKDPWSKTFMDPEWCEVGPPYGPGRTTVTHTTFRPPTHWRLAKPRDLGIEVNREAALVFGNTVRDTPGVPQLDPAERARLLSWASQLASMAKELRAEARAQNEAGRTDLGLLLIRLQLSVEETGEWAECLGYGDIIGAFQELVDMSVVTDGHYLTLGLADLKLEGYREVHAANMSKVGEDGKAHVDAAGRWLKGPNTRKPDMERVLREAGLMT